MSGGGIIEAAGGRLLWVQRGAVRLRVAHFPEGRAGVVLLLHGRTEFIEKYLEPIGELQARGFSVWTLDWRGQGGSTRLAPNPLAHHVGGFEDYLVDVEHLLDTEVEPSLGGRALVLVGQSMGGHIGARLLARRPEAFARAVLLAPMIRFLQGGRLPGAVMRGLVRVACLWPGAVVRFAPGVPRASVHTRAFEGNPLTTCPVRYAADAGHVAADPGLAVGGVTWGWLRAALASIDVLGRAETRGRIGMPVLIAVPEHDRIVDNRATVAFAAGLRDAEVVEIAGARHDLLRERDGARGVLWERIGAFLGRG